MSAGTLFSILFSLVFLPLKPFATQSQSCPVLPTTDASGFAQKNFDYLIVGGGTAGLALASKLSKNRNLVVGVIEAGIFHQNDPLVDTPNFSGDAIGNPSYDWNFVTSPEAGLAGRTIGQPRGKMLGGSSGLNLMAWTRPSQRELDSFEIFAPGSGWNWKGLLPHFKNTENVLLGQNNPFPGIQGGNINDAAFRGHAGPIQASLNVIYPDIIPQYVEAHNSLGIKTNPAPDGGRSDGITNSFLSINRASGARSYAAPAYYCPSSSQATLHVLINAQATKIIFRNNSLPLIAEGVEFTVGSNTFTARASKEVILSAGAVQTPQLLELSGIGDRTILEQAGITTLLNLPGVGENLQEHLFSLVQFLLKDGHQTFDLLRNNATFAAQQAAQYAASHTGWLAATDSTLSFLPLQDFLTNQRFQSLVNTFNAAASQPKLSALQRLQYSIQRQWLMDKTIAQAETILLSKGLVAPQQGESYMTVLAGILHPLSRGSVHVNSNDPLAHPVIVGNYLSNSFDLDVVLETTKFVASLATVSPMSSIVQNITFPPISFTNDAETTGFVQQIASPGDHLLGTCVMAPFGLGGVVDGTLKVYNTSNLRVVDASIIPMLVGAHIQTLAYVIGDKAADFILGA